LASREAIEPAVMAAVGSAGSVVVDLQELTFCDSSGLAILFAAHAKATENGARLTVRHVPPAVRRVFELTRVGDVMELLD
jgi:anti-sigma B factor antagonist